MTEPWDGIILGSGHNALVLQAYLSRAGLRTVTLERNAALGGGLATVENARLPGFLHNPHSFFHRGIPLMPWYRDLELEARGARYIEPALNVAVLFADGRVLEWWTDLERTVASVAELSRRDAAALRRWAEEFAPIVEGILVPEAESPPLAPEARRALLSRSRLGRRLLEVSALSPLEFVSREFQCDAVRAGLLFFNGLREVDLRLPGFGHAVPALLASRRKAAMCAGGSAALARALVADIEAHGGELRTGVRIERIVVEDGRARGVELAGGERLDAARFVASGLNPQQTFIELLADGAVPAAVREKARAFRYNLIAPLFTLDLALAEPPRYAAAAGRPELEQAFMTVLGLEGLGSFHDLVRAHEEGRRPPLVAWGATPTRFDPAQAPAGKHTAFLWQKVPYALEALEAAGDDAGGRERFRERHARELLELWTRYAPNLGRGIILDRFARTPRDTETALPNLARGDLLAGSFEGGQVGRGRPFPEAGGYRTPLQGLYLTGGATHPGGNITGLPGYNAAGVIARDLGLEPWWRPLDLEERLGALPG
jgi:phytoene dehydrogenase-like protein